MKTKVLVSFNEGASSHARMSAMLKAIDCVEGLEPKDSFLCGLFQHTFDSDDSRLADLRRLLRQSGVRWSERIECVYADAELREFPFVNLSVNRKELDAGGPEYGTTYDLSNACSRCGTGAVQVSALMLPLRGLPKKGLLVEAAQGEILVGAELAQAMRAANVSGLELRQVRLYGNGDPLPWWQLISQYEMPRMSSLTRGVITDEIDHVTDSGTVISAMPPCPQCRRDGHYHTIAEPLEIAYAATEVNVASLPDVVHTWECFGVSGIDKGNPRHSRYAPPLIHVKTKVFDVFRALKVKHARFKPVRIVD